MLDRLDRQRLIDIAFWGAFALLSLISLWPLWSVNLWGWLTLPEVIRNLLRAGDFWAFALYFAYLASVARKAGTDADYLPRLRLYTYVQLGLGLIFTVLALLLPYKTYNTLDGAAFLFWAFPNALWVTWRMRATIEVSAIAKLALTGKSRTGFGSPVVPR